MADNLGETGSPKGPECTIDSCVLGVCRRVDVCIDGICGARPEASKEWKDVGVRVAVWNIDGAKNGGTEVHATEHWQ